MKKQIRRVFFVAVLFVLSVSSIRCTKEKAENIVGDWVYQSAVSEMTATWPTPHDTVFDYGEFSMLKDISVYGDGSGYAMVWNGAETLPYQYVPVPFAWKMSDGADTLYFTLNVKQVMLSDPINITACIRELTKNKLSFVVESGKLVSDVSDERITFTYRRK